MTYIGNFGMLFIFYVRMIVMLDATMNDYTNIEQIPNPLLTFDPTSHSLDFSLRVVS